MRKILFIFGLVFFAGLSTSAQFDTLKISPGASKPRIITLKRMKDSVVISSSDKNSSPKYFALKRGAGLAFYKDSIEKEFYTYIYKLAEVDSITNNSYTILGYIKRHSRDSIMVIHLYQQGSLHDSVNTGRGHSTSHVIIDPPEEIDWKYWSVVGSMAVFLMAVLLIALSNKKVEEIDSEVTKKEDAIFGLAKDLKIKTKVGEPESIRQEILKFFETERQKYSGQENELKSKIMMLQSEISAKVKSLGELNTELKKAELQIDLKDKIIAEQLIEINELKYKIESVNVFAARLIDNIFTPLYQRLNDNPNIDPTEAKQIVLKSVLIGAFQSFSFFRIHSNDFHKWDEMNRDIFFAKDVRYLYLANTNSPLNQISPVAYYVMDLLKDHGISELDGVLIFGYKLGENEKHT